MNLERMIQQTLDQNNFVDNIFFQGLKNGELSFEQFVVTQNQFYYAVVHFTRPLALVAGSIPDYESRINILKNIWEEHGEGDINKTHGKTFIEFLKRLTGKEFGQVPAIKAVKQFNETLDETCKSAPYLMSVAMIGMIERMFSEISHFIGAAVIERSWMEPSQMIHYSVHQELDVIHAQDFFDILKPFEDREEEIIREGLALGATTFLMLYHDLLKEAKT